MGILDSDLIKVNIRSIDVIVIRDGVVWWPIHTLRAPEDYGCFITGLRRSQIAPPIHGGTLLYKGDIISLVGNGEQLENLAGILGEVDRDVVKPDLVSFALGIAGRLILGEISIRFGAIAGGIGSKAQLIKTSQLRLKVLLS